MEKVRRTIRFLSLWGVLSGAWIVYTLDFHPHAIILGVFSACLVTIFSFRVFFDQTTEIESRLVYRYDLLFVYLLFLLLQSYLASFSLIWQILRRRNTPGVVRIHTRLQSRIGRTLLANTISLIPGTLSLWLDKNHIHVHVFDIKTTHRIKAGKQIKDPMEGLLMKIFG